MGILSRIVDKLDDAVTDAVTRSGAQREARRIAAGYREGDTICVTNTHRTIFGTHQDLVQEYVVGRGGRVGSETVAGLILRNKSVSRRRPPGLMTVQEYTDMQVAGPDPAKAVSDPHPTKRAKAGARR